MYGTTIQHHTTFNHFKSIHPFISLFTRCWSTNVDEPYYEASANSARLCGVHACLYFSLPPICLSVSLSLLCFSVSCLSLLCLSACLPVCLCCQCKCGLSMLNMLSMCVHAECMSSVHECMDDCRSESLVVSASQAGLHGPHASQPTTNTTTTRISLPYPLVTKLAQANLVKFF